MDGPLTNGCSNSSSNNPLRLSTTLGRCTRNNNTSSTRCPRRAGFYFALAHDPAAPLLSLFFSVFFFRGCGVFAALLLFLVACGARPRGVLEDTSNCCLCVGGARRRQICLNYGLCLTCACGFSTHSRTMSWKKCVLLAAASTAAKVQAAPQRVRCVSLQFVLWLSASVSMYAGSRTNSVL